MTATTRAIGSPILVSRVRLQRCKTTGCSKKTRMAVVVPCADIADDGGPGLAAVVLCGNHIEEALVRWTDAARKEER